MRITHGFAITCAVMVCASCVTSPPGMRELPVPPERIMRDGYSLLPPNEAGWSVVESDARLLLVKRGEGSHENFTVSGDLLPLPPYRTKEELRRLIDSAQLRSNEDHKFVTIMHDVQAATGRDADCFISRDIGEKLLPGKNSNWTSNLIIEKVSLICAHPEDRSVGVRTSYWRSRFLRDSYYMGDQDLAFFEHAAAFLQDVEFNDL